MKRCSKCHAYLSLDNFSRDRARKDGRRSQCKQCCKAYESSAKGKAAKKRYEQSELGRAAQKRYLLCQRMSATRWLAIGRSNLIYTHQQAREQIPGLVKTLNLLVSKADSDTSIDVTVADGFYDIQTIAPNGRIVLLHGALDPMSAWRAINILIDFMRQVHGLDRYGHKEQ